MRVEELIGQRVRERREELQMSQAELGRLLGRLLGKSWSRQTVSAAEQGKRAFTSAELVAIADVLQTRAARLLTPPLNVTELELPSGKRLRAQPLGPDIGINDEYLRQMWDEFARMRTNVDQASKSAGAYEDMLTTLIAASEAATLTDRPEHPSDRPIPVEEALSQPIATAIVTSELGVLVTWRNDGKPPVGFVSGEVEPGESPADAAVREVKEETTLEVQAGERIGERVHPRTGRTMIYMAARPVRGTDVYVGDSEELADVRWVSLAEADELMAEYGMFGPVHEYLQRELGA